MLEGGKYEGHWAFLPPKKATVPDSANWGHNPIDGFIYRKLQESELSPQPEASRETLLRRLTLDITGLPPTPEERDTFLNDKSENAYEKLVDRLLASPRYGERRACFR